jgi:hypothetical protein
LFCLLSFVAYWNGYEVGDIRTATPTFNNVFILENTSQSGGNYSLFVERLIITFSF